MDILSQLAAQGGYTWPSLVTLLGLSVISQVLKYFEQVGIMYPSRKYPYPPQGGSLEIPRGRGLKSQNLKWKI